jgi:hypothetical protein
MKPLDQLRKRLFRKQESFKEREGEPTLSPAPTEGPRTWGSGKDSELTQILKRQQRKRIMRYALFATVTLGIIALATAAYIFVFLGGHAFVTKENIFLMIEAPTKITVGEEVVFEVRFQNRNSIPLESVDLIFEYPENARPVFGDPPRGPFRERVTIGRLLPNEEQRETFTAFLFGNEGDTLTANATLEYRPQNTSARFGKDVSFDVLVDRSPIGVALEIPEHATNSQEIEIIIDYVSTTESLLEDISLDILYPTGFQFESASPLPSKDTNLWHIGDIAPGGEGSIRIRGTVSGNPDESKFFTVRVGLLNTETDGWNSYGQAMKSLVMRDTLLAVSVNASDTQRDGVAPGRTIVFSINWQNNLPVSARNVIVEATLSGESINYAAVRSPKGSYDSIQRRVVWTASQVPEFSFIGPGQTDRLTLTVPILSTLPIETMQDKNFVAHVNVVMFTNIVPEGFAGVETSGNGSASVKIITQLGFASQGLQRSGVLQNTGPLPPQVGQETTYTIAWSLTSSANDMEGVIARTSLPAYVQWKNVFMPAGEHITYDPNTREVVWDVGFLVAGTGYTRPAREVSFQVGIIPGVSHVGRAPDIIAPALVTGRDTFTGFIVEADTRSVSTRLNSDPQVNVREYEVVE